MTASILRRAAVAVLLSAGTVLTAAAPAAAQTIRNDPGFATNVTPRNDDNEFDFLLPFAVTWAGVTTDQIAINNNGYVRVGPGTGAITPCTGGETGGFSATCSSRVFMAYNRDLDSRNSATDPMTYGMGMVNGRQALGVNWFNFGYYSHGGPALNFQLVLIDRADLAAGAFDVEFNYGDMATNGGGRGGWASPDGFGAMAGSNTTEFTNTLGTVGDMRSQFSVVDGVASGITNVGTSTVPEPGTWALMGTGLLGLAGIARRRRSA